jgi:acyl-coenzyme A synthetase/AMP-(fatty) acid ligase
MAHRTNTDSRNPQLGTYRIATFAMATPDHPAVIVEDALIQHPAVADAVIGLPNVEYGQEVKAVVELHAGVLPTSQLAEELVAFCRFWIAAYKCPKSVDFASLPRLPNGKMLKRQIRDQYLAPQRSMEPS